MHHVWAVANNAAIFYLMFEGAWLSVESWRTIHRYMQRHVSVDLLDRHEIASVGRMGLRGSAIWLGGGTVASTMSWGMNQAAPLFIILSVLLAFATLSLLLPAMLVRGTLRDAKRAELESVREKIARARERPSSQAGAGSAAAEQAAVLQGLLAYEARIESVQRMALRSAHADPLRRVRRDRGRLLARRRAGRARAQRHPRLAPARVANASAAGAQRTA